MTSVAVKICGVTDPLVAKQAVKAGIDYIGLVFHAPSKRYVTSEQAMCIADVVHQEGGFIVPVFVSHTVDEILRVSETIKADLVQLHGVIALKAYANIAAHYPCMIATPYCATFDIFDPNRDFLLYDAPTPGSGRMTEWNTLTIDLRFRCFIAGGINRDNIISARDYFHPFGLDISTGVESQPGVKNIKLIEEMIKLL